VGTTRPGASSLSSNPGYGGAEGQLRLVHVVGPTAQRDIGDRRLAADGIRFTVMKLQEAALGAAPAICRDEGTPTAVTQPHGALHRCWDVARPSQRILARTWPFGCGELLPADILEQECQGPVEERAGIAIRDLAAQEILGSAQLLVRQRAVGQQVEDGGEPSAQASGLDTVVGGVLAEPQRPRAVGEERYAEFGIMRTSPLDSASSRVGYSA
jgi:hypothetical protein